MPDDEHWDVFFSYCSSEQSIVEALAIRAEDAGLRVYFDPWRIAAGDAFIPALTRAIKNSRCVAVFVGASGIGPWQNIEWQSGLNRAVSDPSRPMRVVPVLLPGARDHGSDLPDFIALNSWVDFASGGIEDPDAFSRFVKAMRGEAPGSPRRPPNWLRAVRLPAGSRPTGIAVDRGRIFVADHGLGTVTRYDKGEPVRVFEGLAAPHHLAIMGATLLAADTGNGAVVLLDHDLNLMHRVTNFDGAGLNRPHGITSNHPREYYVSDADNNRVLCIRDGQLAGVVGRADLTCGDSDDEFAIPCAVAASPRGLYVADTYNHRVVLLDRALRTIDHFGGYGQGDNEFAYPVGVAVWHDWVLVADEYNKRLQLWRKGLGGQHVWVASDLGGEWIGSPFGLDFDPGVKLWTADRADGQVIEIDFRAMLASLNLPNR